MDAEDVFDTVSGTLGLTGAVDTILVLTKKAHGITLHIRGRDIEDETALAMQFSNGRWSVLGSAPEIQRSSERTQIIKILTDAADGLSVTEIMAGAGLSNRNATDILLFKLAEAGDIERVKRGVYGLPGTTAKIRAKVAEAARGRKNGKIERSEQNELENQGDTNLSANLSNGKDGKIANALNEQGKGGQSFHLSDLSGPQPDVSLDIPAELRRNEPPCDRCGLPCGTECAYDGVVVRLHSHCTRPWIDAYEVRRRNGAGASS